MFINLLSKLSILFKFFYKILNNILKFIVYLNKLIITIAMVKYIENYALYESIGSGVYGKVYRAINNNDKK